MYGFPTMYLASPPCILIKGIRYQVSGIRYPGIQIPDVQISRYPDIRYQIPDIGYQKKDVKARETDFSEKSRISSNE
jgi:hypothetical protein